MNTADVLREAAAVIEERGWCQGQSLADDGRVCTLGALGFATRSNGWTKDALVALWGYLGTADIPTWNDDPLRTEEQVTKTLRVCADSLESDER